MTWLLIAFGIMGYGSYEETVEKLNTPQKICQYMADNFTYTDDSCIEDYWSTPENTYNRNKADCEDYAIFAYEILKCHGYDVYIYKCFVYSDDERSNHAICYYEREGDCGIIDNYELCPELTIDHYIFIKDYVDYEMVDWKIRKKWIVNSDLQ